SETAAQCQWLNEPSGILPGANVLHCRWTVKELSVPANPSTQDVLAVAEACIAPIVDLTTRLTEIPAPTNDEGQRATAVRQEMERHGFSRIKEDELNDVIGVIPGKDSS